MDETLTEDRCADHGAETCKVCFNLRTWALKQPPLALKELCPDEPWVHGANRGVMVDWLMANDTAVLVEMRELNRRG